MHPEEIFTQFVAAINRHDVPALATLMAAEHIFIDSLGRRVEGAASMQAGWRGYFAMCPAYWIRTDNVMAEDSVVLAVGEARRIDQRRGVADARSLEGRDSRGQDDGMAGVRRQQTGVRDPEAELAKK